MPNHDDDDLTDVIECIKIFDENIDILSYMEYYFGSEPEDRLTPIVNKTALIDMAHEVADSARIKKAQSSFMQRHVEPDF